MCVRVPCLIDGQGPKLAVIGYSGMAPVSVVNDSDVQEQGTYCFPEQGDPQTMARQLQRAVLYQIGQQVAAFVLAHRPGKRLFQERESL